MKQYTDRYRQNILSMGRQLDFIITYTLEGQEYVLDASKLLSVSPIVNGGILKSVMKQLNFETTELIPKNTIVTAQLGILVDDALTVKEIDEMKVNRLNILPVKYLSAELKGFKYLSYGNYIIKDEPIYNADTQSYSYVCYDKMLYSMIDYDTLNITYPITIRNYLIAIANRLNLTFKNRTSTFANYNREIPSELYDDKYTYRDILDELAQVTASTICINEQTDELEIRYITETNDTINEEFLKDVNVEFKEKYGPVNSIVLSRSADSDNVYLKDNESIELNGLCEIKIADNQIMNFNDRSDYLPDILAQLDGLEYYLNDFNSTGITWYELCDRYTIQIDNDYYSCVLLNDEININQGLEEIVYTEMPKETQTDYTKADKTDRRINQTYLVVDKQNQVIQSVVSNVTEQNNKISIMQQTVDEINSKISDIADITVSQETLTGRLNCTDINQSEPIHIEIRSTGEQITQLRPSNILYPANNLYIKAHKIRFTNTETNEIFDYELPTDILYYDSENYDEFILDYDSHTVFLNKKCTINLSTGAVELLAEPIVVQYEYPTIELTDGDYRVEMLKYDNTVYACYLMVRLMAKNIYTTQFATKIEMNSEISQTVSDITLSVDQKLTNYSTTTEMNAAITVKANEINSTVSTKVGKNEVISRINQSSEAITINANKISLAGKTIQLTSDNIKINSTNFKVTADGTITCSNANITGKITATSGKIAGYTINGNQLVGNGVGLSGLSGEGYAFWAGSNTPSKAPFRVGHDGSFRATNADISGTITATSGTFRNCTITNSCTVPASTVSGTLATNTIPNISASKITSGTMSGSRIYGGTIGGSTINAVSISTDILHLNNPYYAIEVGNTSSRTGTDYVVYNDGETGWTRLTFTCGILTNIQHNW